MSRIGIIGIGKIGSQLAFDILKDDFVTEIQIYNRNQNKTKALILSLEIAAHQLNKQVNIESLNFENINALDLIMISIKELYDPRIKLSQNEYPAWFPKNLRYCGLYDDLPIIKSITTKMSKFTGIVAVITNPVELMTKFIADNIESKLVFGLGASVDSSRLSFVLNKYYDTRISSNDLLLFGEHGNNLFASRKLLPDNAKDINYNEALNKSNVIGYELVRKNGYTLFDCISPFVNDIKWLLGLNKRLKYRSFSYPASNQMLSHPISFCEEDGRFEGFEDFTTEEKQISLEVEESLNLFYNKILLDIDSFNV